MVLASRGALLRAVNGISGGAGRSLAVSARRLSSPSSSPITTMGYYNRAAVHCAAVPTCPQPDRRRQRPLPFASNISSPGIKIGTATSPRLMSASSGPQYFEGPWHEKYLLLKEYKKDHGNCLVPKSFVLGDVKLGRWVADQRRYYKKDKLSKNRREMLDALGFSWDPQGDKWERNFALLEQFKEREGHCNVLDRHEEDGISLGAWLGTQRTAMKRGRLDESYQRRLEELGISWDPLDDQWERNFALLKQFKEREGHCNVPISHEEDGVKLGIWLSTQRTSMKEEKLDESRQRRLEELGVRWNILADQWERNFALLEQFKEREGHCNVPVLHEEDGVKLGLWLDTMRKVRKGNVRGKLSSERIERLDKLGVSWDPVKDQWEQKFSLLVQFKEREGHCNVPHLHEEDGVKLGMWLSTLRQVRRGNTSGHLSSERIERLENLGVFWYPLEDQWERNFALLEQFKEREGHCNVPFSHEEGEWKLGRWLDRLRQVRKGNKDGKLSSERIERLDEIGIRW